MNDRRFPSQTNRTKADGETVLTSDGWMRRFYKVSSGDFRINRKNLRICDDLSVEEIVLDEGSLRIDGVLGDGELQICLIESKEYRLLGLTASNPLQTVLYDGAFWDVTLVSPAQLITLNAANALTAKILHGASGEALRSKMRICDGENRQEALVLPMTRQSALLSQSIKQCLALSTFTDFREADCLALNWMRDDLIEIAASVIDALEELEGPIFTVGQRHRRLIAKEIENTLWLSPIEIENGTSLDDFSYNFGCSRRSIQQAVHETFGISFTALRRSIRLHQAKSSIGAMPEKSVMQIAHEHDFYNAGRFAAYYKDFFGRSPKEDRNEI